MPDTTTQQPPRLTKNMRAALEQLARQPARHSGPGRPAWPHHPNTLNALLRRELVDHTVDRDRDGNVRQTWQTNDQGKAALEPREIRRTEPTLYLARPGGTRFKTLPNGRQAIDDTNPGTGDYTTDPSRAIDRTPVMRAPDPEWARRSVRRLMRCQTNSEKTRRLTLAYRKAAA